MHDSGGVDLKNAYKKGSLYVCLNLQSLYCNIIIIIFELTLLQSKFLPRDVCHHQKGGVCEYMP